MDGPSTGGMSSSSSKRAPPASLTTIDTSPSGTSAAVAATENGSLVGGTSSSMERQPPFTTAAADASTTAFPEEYAMSEPGGDSDDESTPTVSVPRVPRRPLTLVQMLRLFACSFSYAFIFNTLNNIVIPKEIERLAASRQSVWVGGIMAAGAICQLATPVVGAASDRSGGQRAPYLTYGALLTTVGVVLFLAVSSLSDLGLLFLAHVLTSTGLSMQYSMVTALLNDHVPEEQIGKGSGVVAILAVVGSGAGYVMFAAGAPVMYSYVGYVASTVVCLVVTLLAVPSAPHSSSGAASSPLVVSSGKNTSDNGGGSSSAMAPASGGGGDGLTARKTRAAAAAASTPHVVPRPTTPHGAAVVVSNGSGGIAPGTGHHSPPPGCICRLISDIGHALSIPSPSKFPDFFFACTGRALFNTGLAGQVYLVYYFRDVLRADAPTQLASLAAVMALVGGIIGALPAGVISDRVGKKPVIYWSVVLCTVALILFMLASSPGEIRFIGLVYGVGNVAYLSVDYALGIQSLPRKQLPGSARRTVPIDAAKDLGVFAMSATLGQLFGQMVYAAVLENFSYSTPGGFVQYEYGGFVAVYGIGCLMFVLSGVATMFVKSVR